MAASSAATASVERCWGRQRGGSVGRAAAAARQRCKGVVSGVAMSAAGGERRQLGSSGGGGSGDSKPVEVEAGQRSGSAAAAGRAAAARRRQVARLQCGNGDGRSVLAEVVAARRQRWHGGGTASAVATAWRWRWQICGSVAGRETAAWRRRQLSYARTTHTSLFFPSVKRAIFWYDWSSCHEIVP